jgi:hypothetical protein
MPEFVTTIEIWFESPDQEAADRLAEELAGLAIMWPSVIAVEGTSAEAMD